MHTLLRGTDDKEIEQALDASWDQVPAGSTVWRLDVAHHGDADAPSYRAWQQGDRHLAAHILLAGIGLPHDPDVQAERHQPMIDLLGSMRAFIDKGGRLERVVVIDPADREDPLGGLAWRHELLWPLIYMPRGERVWQLSHQACKEAGVVVPDYDVNDFTATMFETYYEEPRRRVFYDLDHPEDLGRIQAAWQLRAVVTELIRSGAGVELEPLDESLW
ncbi:MAG TPA: hypothetical protein VK694_01050 [Verrucomicrobiae bacterium]|nr:hypothetical protein [Verrucomicrobiae bacterium]